MKKILAISIIFILLSVGYGSIFSYSSVLTPLPKIDSDGDFLYDYEEKAIGTDPFNPDTDEDGLSDLKELEHGTDPVNFDTDGDGMKDGLELGADQGSTSPLETDTDHDGLPDPWEDNDQDGILNREEQLPRHDGISVLFDYFSKDAANENANPHILDVASGNCVAFTDPNDDDTDNDGIPDGYEIQVNNSLTYDPTKTTPDRDNANLDISNPSSPISWLVTNAYGWDNAMFADWVKGMDMAYQYGVLDQPTHSIAWYNVCPQYIWEQFTLLGHPVGDSSFPYFLSTFFHSTAANSYANGVTNQTVRGWWDYNTPYAWNRYDSDPTLEDTDSDLMEDDWDPEPLIYNPRYDTYVVVPNIAKYENGTIKNYSAMQPYEPKFGQFGMNISGLELEKGDRIDLTVAVGFEKMAPANASTNDWNPCNVTIGFRPIGLGESPFPHDGDEDLEQDNASRRTRRFLNVGAGNVYNGLIEIPFINHYGQASHMTFYSYTYENIIIPARVPAGHMALVMAVDTTGNIDYYPSELYFIW